MIAKIYFSKKAAKKMLRAIIPGRQSYVIDTIEHFNVAIYTSDITILGYKAYPITAINTYYGTGFGEREIAAVVNHIKSLGGRVRVEYI